MSGLVGAWPTGLSALQFSLIRTVSAEGLGLTPLKLPPRGPAGGGTSQRAIMEFAEQYAVDVTEITPRQRDAWVGELGDIALQAAYAVFVADAVPRVRTALDALFGADEWYDIAPTETPSIRVVVDEFAREVALLDDFDPITRELMRLRAARTINSRMCMQRRNLDAIDAGADASLFLAADDFRASTLISPAQTAALALLDAVLWTPADIRSRDLDHAREHLSSAQAVEAVLAAAWFCSYKPVVALDLDAPTWSGIQFFTFDDLGDLRIH